MSSTAFVSAIPIRSGKSFLRSRSNICTSFTSNKVPPTKLVRPINIRNQVKMISAELARNAIAVYGVVIAGGGIGAFLRSGSKPSIISGVTAGIILAAAYVKDSVPIALGTAIALTIVFGIRLIKTKKFIPAGLLCFASIAAAAFFAASIYA